MYRQRYRGRPADTLASQVAADLAQTIDQRDALGVARARAQIETAYGIAEDWMRGGPWALGDTFTLADCAAAPALFYANEVLPFGEERKHLAAYSTRLRERPS